MSDVQNHTLLALVFTIVVIFFLVKTFGRAPRLLTAARQPYLKRGRGPQCDRKLLALVPRQRWRSIVSPVISMDLPCKKGRSSKTINIAKKIVRIIVYFDVQENS